VKVEVPLRSSGDLVKVEVPLRISGDPVKVEVPLKSSVVLVPAKRPELTVQTKRYLIINFPFNLRIITEALPGG
jgi:hypothetical protein